MVTAVEGEKGKGMTLSAVTATVEGRQEKRLTRAQKKLKEQEEHRIVKRMACLSNLLEQVTVLEGKKRKGKTLSAVAILYNLRNLFGLNIVTVGSKMGLNTSFGPYQVLDERRFLGELEQIADVSRAITDTELQEAVDIVLVKLGVSIYGSAIAFDEAYKLFEPRTPTDKLVRVFGYFIAQSAHYHATVLLMTPSRKDLDRRVRQQVDWYGRCSFLKRSQSVLVRFKQGYSNKFKLTVDGPRYFNMYDTYTLLGYRQKSLEVETI